MDALSQLDELAESDILEALGKDSIKNDNKMPSSDEKSIQIDNYQESNDEPSETISLDSSLSKDDLSSLINELLSNKTLEITIKIKD